MIELIPAIDIIGGKCVRLSQGKYHSKKIYSDNPADMARCFEAHGIKRLHVVDLDGAASQHVVNLRVLEQIASSTNLIIDFGGGVKTLDDLNAVFNCGAQMVTMGSIAVKQPENFLQWLKMYGSERIILGADIKGEKVAINGWMEESKCGLFSFLADYVEKGVRKVICTDISRDGMLQGPAISLYIEIMHRHPDLHLIASGGVSSIDDIRKLYEAGIPGVIFGKALYEGRITLKEIENLILHGE